MFIVSCELTSAATSASCFSCLCENICPLPTHCSEGSISFFECARILSLFAPKLTVKHFSKNGLVVQCLMYVAVKTPSPDYSNIHQSVRQSLPSASKIHFSCSSKCLMQRTLICYDL